jgi:hypothetical protein
MPESTILPRAISVRKVTKAEDGSYGLWLYLRDNATTRTIIDLEGNPTTLYVYDEVHVHIQLPAEVANKLDLRILKGHWREWHKRRQDKLRPAIRELMKKKLSRQKLAAAKIKAVNHRDELSEVGNVTTVRQVLGSLARWNNKELTVG